MSEDVKEIVLWTVIIFVDIMIDAVIIGLIMKKPVNHTTTANMAIHRLVGHLMIRLV